MKVVSSSTLGFPRMGPRRELKFALEKYWKKGSTFSEADLLSVARAVEEQAWALQAAKVDKVTVGDHYLYDGILTWTEFLGIFPKLFNSKKPGLERMFAMARGDDGSPALSTLKAHDAHC
jgi:5-methyltetrahydropteroyltriglutamate--homocysteine methyltransferase